MIFTDGFHISADTSKQLMKFLHDQNFDLKFLFEMGLSKHYNCPIKHKTRLNALIDADVVVLMNEANYYKRFKSNQNGIQ